MIYEESPRIFNQGRRFVMSSPSIHRSHVTKKETRGSKDKDLGQVQQAMQNYILVERQMLNKEEFCIRRDIAENCGRGFSISK